MKDIRPKAEERARRRQVTQSVQPNTRPPSDGFLSERARAKEALRSEVNTYTGENVRKIAATSAQAQEERTLRVAAYCRVSTDDIDQLVSIELQKNNYRDMIRANPKWRYVGTYVDDGFSGTNTDHRPAFQLMMKDAMAGKIDMIITKSVSRFARNLLDCIGWVRRLKERDPPIQVFFEQEHLNTLDTTSNIILFVLAMVAEEESHMKSEAMLLSLEWRFSRGRFLTPALLGYDKVTLSDGRKVLRINEDEALTVRLMYYMLLNGRTTPEIAETLTDLGRETGLRKVCGRSNIIWTDQMVASYLRNERYCGDVLARKTWTPDFHNHKSVRNTGSKNRYYQSGHHEAIVTRAQWNAAQRILNSHIYGHTGGYLPMRVIDHGALAGYISMNRSWAGYDADEYFRVCSIAMGLSDGELEIDPETEYLPDGGHRLAGLTDDGGIQRIARVLTEAEKAIKAQIEGAPQPEQEKEAVPKARDGFQVVSGSMFSHVLTPYVRIAPGSLYFSRPCVTRLLRLDRTPCSGQAPCAKQPNGVTEPRYQEYVEVLLNPVERMLAVRPCEVNHPNAIRWVDAKGRSRWLSAKAFCTILYEVLGWDDTYSYRVPAIPRIRNGEAIILFDLDNYVGVPLRRTDATEEPDIEVPGGPPRHEDTKGIFYGAEDDEAQEVTDTEEMEKRLRELAEYERRHFGTPAFEHDGNVRLPGIDDNGEWNVMAEARVLGDDHRVDDSLVEALQEKMMGPISLWANEEADEETDDEGSGEPIDEKGGTI